MDLNPMQASYFCEDQIDELNDTYFAFCSQVEQSSQFVQSQSQAEGSQYEGTETSDETTTQPKPLDFEAAFMKFIGLSKERSPDIVRTNLNVTAPENFHSQTDFEAMTHACIIQNPHLANEANNPTIETFLDCTQYFETIKASPKKAPKTAKGPFNEIRFKIGPQVLMIADIRKIDIDPLNSGPLNSERMLYGQKFKSVMFYGRCEPHRVQFTKGIDGSQSENIKRKYVVDDGSDKIIVHTSEFTNSQFRGQKEAVHRLRHELEMARKHGMPFLGNDLYKSHTPKCKAVLDDSKTILGVIDRNLAQNKLALRNGSKVCVVGAPFRHSRTNEIEIIAYRVHEDSGPDRQMELSFKDNLIHVYETKLFQFKITGERI